MNLVSKFLAFTLLGAGWVLWLLVGLSVLSIAIMIERLFFFSGQRADVDGLIDGLKKKLRADEADGARKWLGGMSSMEARVALAGIDVLDRGPDAVGEAMTGAKARERLRFERYLTFLATLGNNAPFIGLFGTVIGIIKAFHDLAINSTGGATVVMAGISEALVATAIGLMVALPAVAGHNIIQRTVRSKVANTDAVAHLILGEIKGREVAGEATKAAS
jgi:biopolymer transport protein ExbB